MKTEIWRGSFAWPSEKEIKEEERIVHKIEKQFFNSMKKAKTVEFITENGKRYKYELKSMKRIDGEAELTLGNIIRKENKCLQ